MKEQKLLAAALAKRVACVTLALALVFGGAFSAFGAEPETEVGGPQDLSTRDPRIKEFPDVPKGHFAHESIEFCSMWLMQGKEDGKFHPNSYLTRAEAVQILRNGAGMIDITENAIFSDVKPGVWYYEALSFAAEQKLCKGFEDGTFRPDQILTYEQFAVMIHNYMKWQYPVWFERAKPLKDLPAYAKYSEFSKDALIFIEYLTKPAGPEKIDATKPMTRAEAAIFAHRANNTTLRVWDI